MTSLRKAINAHCKSCGYDPLDKGTWRYQIEICPVTQCELYEVRPKTLPKRADSQNKEVREGSPTG